MFGAPGTDNWASGLAGGLRGSLVMDGVLYVVAGNMVYSIDSNGAETSLGTINTSSGPVSMAHNDASTKELVLVDGVDGWEYDTANGLVQITDPEFLPADVVTYQDGYFIFNRAGTAQFFLSNLNNAGAYDLTDRATAEGAPDVLVSLISNHRELWLFGAETTEVWFNSGDADFPFERISGAFIERGCGAAHSIAEEDNTLFWFGEDRTVYRAHGYTPQRISTFAIEEQWRDYVTVSDAYAFTYTMGGHKFYVITFPSGKGTFVYDISTGFWHERESFGEGKWRGCCYANAYGKHLIGDYESGRMGILDLDVYTEYGETMIGTLTGPPVAQDRMRLFHAKFELDIESGVGITTGQGSDPQIMMDYSDDGGRTFNNRQLWRSMGKIGEYQARLRWMQQGQSRNRIYRVSVSDPVKRSIISAHLDIAPGVG